MKTIFVSLRGIIADIRVYVREGNDDSTIFIFIVLFLNPVVSFYFKFIFIRLYFNHVSSISFKIIFDIL